jgi:TPR repeat protein
MEDQSNGKTLFTFVTARRVLIVLSIVAIAAFFTLITLYSERITAELGDTHAQFNLGVHYHDGDHGLPQDFAEAARWYYKAAEQGFAPAQNNLGALYWMGDGVPQDRAEAVRWHRKAAEQGDPNAQYNLGTSLAYGRGVPKDLQQAYVWLSLAVAQGDTKAHANQDFVASQLDRESIANAQRRAAEFVPKKQGKDILDTKR